MTTTHCGSQPGGASVERKLVRKQLEEWGLPYETAALGEAAQGRAVELCREPTGTRRLVVPDCWISVDRLVFLAPDDGLSWEVTYENWPERYRSNDPWDGRPQVTARCAEGYSEGVHVSDGKSTLDDEVDDEPVPDSRETCWFWESRAGKCHFESLIPGSGPCADCPDEPA